ncbi:hypothetical protein E2C01_070291 [Portunus trituberculatus]|uniref:Uncharacterized protein n=1 Tax=Portunus trituberculatus TaxID=210409 RepID=A0A5B7HWW5_PORTR|nr:hypothetical protein [Portunus trituberculatus]
MKEQYQTYVGDQNSEDWSLTPSVPGHVFIFILLTIW